MAEIEQILGIRDGLLAVGSVVQREFAAKCRFGVFVAAEFALGHADPVEHFDQVFRTDAGFAFHVGERRREVFERAGEFAVLVGALAVGEQVRRDVRGGLVLHDVGEADAVEHGADQQTVVVADQIAADVGLEPASAPRPGRVGELPAVYGPACLVAELQAVVFGQLARMLGRAVFLQVRRRGDEQRALRPAEPLRDHAGLEFFRKADAGIEPFGDEVGERGVSADIQADFGIGTQKIGEVRRDQRGQRDRRHGDAQRARGAAAAVAHFLDRAVDLAERGRDAREEILARDALTSRSRAARVKLPFTAIARNARSATVWSWRID